MSVANNAASWAENIANDNSHGYGWGGWGPDYDCGHLVIMAYENAGVRLRAAGASYTGNMLSACLACGFQNVTGSVNLATGAGMVRGDILLNREKHAAMYTGGGKLVQARNDLDGVPGDSSGQEIRVQGYYNFPWDYVLRLAETPATPSTPAPAVSGDQSGSGTTITPTPTPDTTQRFNVGDVVNFKGTKHYFSASADSAAYCKPGEAKVTSVCMTGKHQYHLIWISGSTSNVYGWVDAADIEPKAQPQPEEEKGETPPAPEVTTEPERDEAPSVEIKAGSVVRIKDGARDYNGRKLLSFVYKRNHVVKQLSGDRAVVTFAGIIVAAVNVADLEAV